MHKTEVYPSMENTSKWSASALVAFSLASLAPQAFPAGATLYEAGTLDMGMAGAGRAALAMDASTAFTNPAGMSRLQGDSISAAAVPFYMTAEFSPDS
ncbi:MAG: outer membrane protein transport protein, partial [bacterium]